MNPGSRKMIEIEAQFEQNSYNKWLEKAKSEASEINRHMKHLESANYDDITALRNIISIASDAIYSLAIAHEHQSAANSIKAALELIDTEKG